METLKLKITGVTPLMFHADTLANPLLAVSKAHKALTAKRKKVDEDHLAIAKSEFLSSCYWNPEDKFFIPAANLDATFLGGAKLQKLGVRWKQAALILEQRVKLLHDGPSTPEKLWDEPRFIDVRGVRVGQSKVMRYRPVFLSWAAELTVALNTDVLDMGEAQKAIADAGKLIGTCEFRPRFGRFTVQYV